MSRRKLSSEEQRQRNRESNARWRERNRLEINRNARERYAANPELYKARILKWRAKYPGRYEDILRKNRKKYLAARSLKRKRDPAFAAKENARTREWAQLHKEYLREYSRNKVRRLVANNINYAIRKRLRNRIGMALSKNPKLGRTLELLGCSIPEFRIYLESKFEPGMNWQNWGNGPDKWNLDHIMPCAIFDLTKPEHQKRCFHFSNYQPLWQPANLLKGCRVLSST